MSALIGTVLTLTGSAQNLHTALVAASKVPAGTKYVKSVQLQPYSTNANPIFIGESAVATETNALAYLTTGMTFALNGGDAGVVDLYSVYLIGTEGEKVHVALLP